MLQMFLVVGLGLGILKSSKKSWFPGRLWKPWGKNPIISSSPPLRKIILGSKTFSDDLRSLIQFEVTMGSRPNRFSSKNVFFAILLQQKFNLYQSNAVIDYIGVNCKSGDFGDTGRPPWGTVGFVGGYYFLSNVANMPFLHYLEKPVRYS